ncbi:MAG: MoxR family ATPase [Casimicrobiaceae bacterium]
MYYTADVKDIPPEDSSAGTVYGTDHPAGYQPDPGLVDAVNVALGLDRPLLVTGEPGTGKTQLASSVAWQLARRKLLNIASANVEKFETKSTSVARDLFYSFDTLRRFQAAYTKGSDNNVDYLTYNALGRSLLNAMPLADVAPLVSADFDYAGPVRSVVLIDEIDKAPRDFPNDLLNEIDQMFFRIPELKNVQIGGTGKLKDEYRPLVFITSNSEKNLPDPFLRRCIFYNIPFPDPERLQEILLARLARLSALKGPLVADALRFFLELRDNNVTKRKISPAELIQWQSYMLSRKANPAHPLKAAGEIARAGISALAKDPDDLERVRTALDAFLSRK